MLNGFDKTIDYGYDSAAVRYGIKYGSGKIVFVKAGLGGGIPGYGEKYLRIAEGLNERYGCTVICASNPTEIRDQSAIDKFAIDEVASELGITSFEVFFFGHSNGGVKGLELARKGVSFKKMMLVNMPLMINMFTLKDIIKGMPDTEVVMVYGELDPSLFYTAFFNGIRDNVKVSVITGADHNFTGYLEEFIQLADRLFLD